MLGRRVSPEFIDRDPDKFARMLERGHAWCDDDGGWYITSFVELWLIGAFRASDAEMLRWLDPAHGPEEGPL